MNCSPENVGISGAGLRIAFQAYCRCVYRDQGGGGVMAVAREGKLCFLKAFGNSVELDTMFDTGWMTNSVIALATFLLIDRGELALDTPLSYY